MKKIFSVVGVAVVTALSGYLVAYLQQPDNYAKVSKKAKQYSAKLNKSAKAYVKKSKKLFAKKLKEYNL